MITSDQKIQFSNALQIFCERQKSVSEVAREIGVNRQQFQKYLNGQTFPSAHMRRRIARFFDVPPEDLFDPAKAEAAHHATAGAELAAPLPLPELARLRDYAGIYHVYFISPAFPDLIHVGVSLLHETNGVMESNFFVRSRDPKTGLVHRSQLKGTVHLRGERLFVLERSKKGQDRFSETILLPNHGDRMRYLTGMSIGLTWHPDSSPYASRTIWRRALGTPSLRDAIRLCGLFPANSGLIDSPVRNFFKTDELHSNMLVL